MTPSPHPEFKVDVSRAAVAQWRNLVKRAQAIGAATEVRKQCARRSKPFKQTRSVLATPSIEPSSRAAMFVEESALL